MDVARKIAWRLLPPVLWASGRAWMRLFGCSVASSARIFGRPILWRNRGTITVGERAELHSLRSLAMLGQEFPACFLATAPGGTIVIEDDALIVASAIFAQEKVFIGKRTMIAAGCRITDSNMHEADRVPRRYAEHAGAIPVTLEEDVWLCAGVTVCPGVRIGKGSVIGAGSVVTSDIPPMVMAAGSPARVMRPLRAA